MVDFSSGWGGASTSKSKNTSSGSNVSGLYDLFSSQASAPQANAANSRVATGKSSWLSDKFDDLEGGVSDFVSNPLNLVFPTSVGATSAAVNAVTSSGILPDTSTPETPDPMLTALEQAGLSKDLAAWVLSMNRVDQQTPYGNSTYSQNPTTGQYTQTVSLSPAQQKLLDTQTELQTGLGTAAGNLVNQVNDIYSSPIDFSGAPTIRQGNTINNVATGAINNSIDPYGSIQGTVSNAGDIQKQVDTSGINPLRYNASYGNIQNGVDMSGVPSLVGGQDLLNFQNQARDAAWQNAQAALNPQWDTYESRLETKLANQGVLQGSDAWNKAISEMSRNRQYDYSQAQNNAVNQGLTAANQLYNQGLSSNQNAYSQALNNANFANSAQAQGWGQDYQNAQLGNQASLDMFNARRAVMSDNNAAQQQAYNQNLSNATLNNAAQNQGFTQNQAMANFGNEAQRQAYLQGLGNAELNNSAVNQNNANDIANRNQYINELLQQYQMPLSALSSIQSGTQPTMPTFSSVPQVSGVTAPDYTGLVSNNAALANGTYNSMLSGGTSALASLLSTLLA